MKLTARLTWIVVGGGVVGVALLWLGVGCVADDATEKSELYVELYKITYRFYLLAVLGGAVSLIYQEFSRLRARTAARLDKVRDQSRLLASELFSAYGEFVAIWKAWNFSKECQNNEWDLAISIDLEALFQRALAAEGSMESLLVNLSSRQVLTAKQLSDLAKIRQAFQQLRERMRADERIPWPSSDDERYREFKRLVTVVGTLLSSTEEVTEPKPEEAYQAWLEITSNKHEGYWD